MGSFKEAISRAFKSADNSLAVQVGDQTTSPLDLYFTKQLGPAVFLDSDATINTNTITLTDASDFVIGDICTLISATGNFYSSFITNKVSNTLTLASPLDFAFTTADEAIPGSPSVNVDGSTTPQTFLIRGEGGTINVPIKIDITRIMIQMVTTGATEFGKFGDITGGLDNGIILRRVNGETKNFWSARLNEDLSLLAYDLTPFEAAKPTGVNGLAMRYTFAGQDKHGVAVRLDIDDSLQLIVQDDLSSLLSFNIMAQGHIVEE